MKKLKRIITIFSILIFISLTFVGCDNSSKENSENRDDGSLIRSDMSLSLSADATTSKNYDGRAFYEIFVRSFNDSNGDGIGDLDGVTAKLDYLEELGIKGIWLMPINESSSYHGYDVDDYYSIESDYGSMEDLEELIAEAHKRDIKVIMDLVINHSSINNKWFINAREGEDSEYRDYYIWTDDMTRANEKTSMGTDVWNRNGSKKELYNSIFWSGMPDLNMDNPEVVQEVKNIAKLYLDKGIDGFRMDAAKWIFMETDKNVAFWKDFNSYIKSVNKDSILVGEVWDEPENMLPYTEGVDSFFEFSIGDNISDGINGNSISEFPDEYNKVANLYKDANSEFVMAPFLRNHDQARVIDSFKDKFQMKMASVMYLTLPGTPYIYYGEEIGMSGGKPDERIREPFVWDSSDMSKNTSWEMILSTDTLKVAINVEEADKNSLLNFYKDILKVRNNYPSLRYGEVKSVKTDDNNIMAMERSYKDEITYVLINGNSKVGSAEVPKGDYKVVYSNKGKKDIINSNGNFDVEKDEILIIIKK